MGTIIAFANQKGGVAKTTSTYNIGVALAREGKSTLLIDFDSQASLTISAGLEPYDMDYTIVNALQNKNAVPISRCLKHLRRNLFLVPASLELARLEVVMIGRAARETILRRILEPIRNKFDFILIDCPPQLSILTINALSCADHVLIPCKTDYLAYRGLELLLESIDEVQELVNPQLNIMGVIATLYDMRVSEDKRMLQMLSEKFDVIGVVKQLVSVKRGICDGTAVTELMKDDDAALEYRKIAAHIIAT